MLKDHVRHIRIRPVGKVLTWMEDQHQDRDRFLTSRLIKTYRHIDHQTYFHFWAKMAMLLAITTD